MEKGERHPGRVLAVAVGLTLVVGCLPPPHIFWARSRGGPVEVGDSVGLAAAVCALPGQQCRLKDTIVAVVADTTVARVRTGGFVQGVAPGRTNVYLLTRRAPPESIPITIIPAIRWLNLRPHTITVRPGQRAEFSVTAHDSLGDTVSGAAFRYDLDLEELILATHTARGERIWITGMGPGTYLVVVYLAGRDDIADTAQLVIRR
ncbi:MAG TPA: hypothetical protein VJU87_06460 [Gemmatimonadaceae bacterium]|nr:hypothetical protein [Gemmatimonadaceae bacterium]